MKNLICWLAILYCLPQFTHAQNLVLDFGGDGDQLIAESPITGTDDFTAELWFNSRNTESFVNLISWGDRGQDFPNRFNFYLFNDRLALVDDAYGSSLIFPSNIDINPDGSWHHLAISKSGNEISIYHNEAVFSYSTNQAREFNLLPNLIIGYKANQSLAGWEGQIDEFRMWDYARSASEISSTANCTLTEIEQGLIVYYHFDNGSYVAIDGNIRVENSANNDFLHTAILDGFALTGAASNVVPLEGRSPTACGSSDQECSIPFNLNIFECGLINVNIEDPNLEYNYTWNFGDGTSSNELNTNHQYAESGTYTLCLSSPNIEGCQEGICSDISVTVTDLPILIIDNSPIVVTQDPERNCLGYPTFPLPKIESCSDADQVYVRSDGKEFNEGYAIGSHEVRLIISNQFGADSARYLVIVNANIQCAEGENDICSAQCEPVSFVNLSTGVDENGNKLPSGIGETDPFWKLVNKAPAEAGCENLTSAINGLAYLNNWVFPDVTTWANLPGATPIAPVNIGNNGRFGCNNLSNNSGQIVPYIFERTFCICEPGNYNFDFTFKGDDRAFLELWNLTTDKLIASSSTYIYRNLNDPATWQFTQNLGNGEYAIRANLANTSSTTLGLTVNGSVSSESTNLREIGSCCDPKNINVRTILDLDCSGTIGEGDMPEPGWTYNLLNAAGTIIDSKETDINGELFFNALDPGTYTVQQVLQPGWTANIPSSGNITIEVTENSFNSVDFLNCEAGCFSIETSDIVCNNDLSYNVTIQLKNENDQVFDRLLMFSQSNKTAVNPTVSLDFGDDQGTLSPGEVSGDISFTVTQLEFVDQPIDICFDVIPQNPEGGNCCKDQFCVTLPVCCIPEETTSISVTPADNTEQCCYEIFVENECAQDYYKELEIKMLTDGLDLSIQTLGNNLVIYTEEEYLVVRSPEGETGFLPTGNYLVAQLCIEGLTPNSPEIQELEFTWVTTGPDGQNIPLTSTTQMLDCPPPPDECAMITNMNVTCIENNQYRLTFDLQNESFDNVTAQQIIIAPEGNTTVDNYSPQSFDNINLAPGESQSFSIDITGLSEGQNFDFSLSMHDYNNILEDGNYWCCFNDVAQTVTLRGCEDSLLFGESEEISFTVFPNPVNDQVTISFDKASKSPMQLSLINLNGEVLDSKNLSTEKSEFIYSLENNFPSIYWIKVQDEQGRVSYQKIIKL